MNRNIIGMKEGGATSNIDKYDKKGEKNKSIRSNDASSLVAEEEE